MRLRSTVGHKAYYHSFVSTAAASAFFENLPKISERGIFIVVGESQRRHRLCNLLSVEFHDGTHVQIRGVRLESTKELLRFL